jgi:hypothetical protein
MHQLLARLYSFFVYEDTVTHNCHDIQEETTQSSDLIKRLNRIDQACPWNNPNNSSRIRCVSFQDPCYKFNEKLTTQQTQERMAGADKLGLKQPSSSSHA